MVREDKNSEKRRTANALASPPANKAKAALAALNSAPKFADLIYDVGMHRGEDTDFYLKKGFRVVGFEANPENAEFCRRRFRREIEENRLTIVEGAIVEPEFIDSAPEKIKFYRNVDHSPWGSACRNWAKRNEALGTSSQIIEVEPVNFKECLERYGVPHYLKADIVGLETICLSALLEFENKPDFVSIRSEKYVFARLKREFELFAQLGYGNFQAVQQDVSQMSALLDTKKGEKIAYNFGEGASGVFGEDLGADWKSQTEIIRQYRRIFILYRFFGDYSLLRRFAAGRKTISFLERVVRRPLPGWYDTHARHSAVKLLGLFFSAAQVVAPQV